MSATFPLRRLAGFLAATAALLLCAGTLAAAAAPWTIDPAASSLTFTAVQGGAPVDGRFEIWTAEIDFDPATPETATIRATIETGSATTGQGQVDGVLPTAAWFDAATFPEAEFAAVGARTLGDGRYEADGTLTIKGVSVPVTLPFELSIDGGIARARGTVSLARTAWELGAGIPEGTVADEVTVTFDLTATQ